MSRSRRQRAWPSIQRWRTLYITLTAATATPTAVAHLRDVLTQKLHKLLSNLQQLVPEAAGLRRRCGTAARPRLGRPGCPALGRIVAELLVQIPEEVVCG